MEITKDDILFGKWVEACLQMSHPATALNIKSGCITKYKVFDGDSFNALTHIPGKWVPW